MPGRSSTRQTRGETIQVSGIFNDRSRAENAVDELIDRGLNDESIGVFWRDKSRPEQEEYEVVTYEDHHSSAGAEAGKGAVGGAVGGATAGAGTVLLASAGVALVPGIGALLAAGTAAAAAAGAAAGAVGGGVTGGVFGALIGAGDSDATKQVETKTRYRQALDRDGVVVTVDTDEESSAEISHILRSAGASDVEVLTDEPNED